MHFVKYLIFSYLVFISPSTLAQIDTTLMDRMNKSDLVAGKVSNEVRVVSASRSSRSVNDVPISIQVVTREEIERNGYVTLVDVLKHIGGIRTSKPGNGVDGETFLMRGLIGNYYTKILINSIPIQASVSGSIAIAEQLPVIQAERIEIIFGPSSAIYGGDAMAGVINIITRGTESTPFAQATLTTGEYGYRNGSFMAGGKAGRNKDVVKYTIYGNFSERETNNVAYDRENYSSFNSSAISEGEKEFARQFPDQFLKETFPYYKGTLAEPVIGDMPQRSYLIGGQMEYRGFQGSYLEMKRESFASTGLTPLLFGYNNPDTFYGDKMRRLTLSYNHDWGKWSFTTNLSYNHYRYLTRTSRASTYDGFNGRSYKYEASDDVFAEQLVRRNLGSWEFTAGTSFLYANTLPETNDLEAPFDASTYKAFKKFTPTLHPLYGAFGYNPISFTNLGIFGQAVYIKGRWSFIYGGRADLNTFIQGAGRTRLAIQYKKTDKLSFRFSQGGAFKAPAPHLAYSSTALPAPPPFATNIVNYQQVPASNLKPEELSSSEFGMRYQLSKNTFLEVIAYRQVNRQRLNNLTLPIDILKYPNAFNNGINGPVARIYKNDSSSKSTLTSLQILFKQKDLFQAWRMNIDISLTFNNGREVLPGGAGNINAYRMLPLFLAQANIDFTPHKNWYIRLESVMSSKWYRNDIPIAAEYNSAFNTIKGYVTIDMVVRYKWSKHIFTCLKIINITNAKYGGIDATGLDIDLRYNPQLGRNIQLGINFNLD